MTRDAQAEAVRTEIYLRMSGGEKIAPASELREEAITITRDTVS
jgi:hypothetical protein